MNRNSWIVIIVAAVLLMVIVVAGLNKSLGQFSPAQGKTGSLTVISNPSGAGLSIDKSYKGLTPITVASLSVGYHTVLIIKPGYNDYSTKKYIYKGNNLLNVTLTPATNQTIPANQTNQTGQAGILQVLSTPSGASIYLDGAYNGLTPRNFTNLTNGNHEVNLTKTGYQKYSTVALVEQGKTTVVNAILTLQTNATGSLSVTSNPSSASLYIDNLYRGLTPITVSSLSIGNHNVRVTKAGYNNYSTTKFIVEGANALNVNLTLASNQTG